MQVLFLKGGEGSGWHGPPKGTHLPSSSGIRSLKEAQAYWREHFARKTLPIVVHSGGRETHIRVRFDARNPDAYTDSRDERGQKLPQRLFSAKRAAAMSRLLQTIEHPQRRLRSYDSDLFLEAPVDGERYTVVLTWKPGAGVYEFNSAHFKTVDEVLRLQKYQPSRKNDGPLQKGGPYCTGPSVLRGLYGPGGGGSSTGSQPHTAAPARDCGQNIADLSAIFKAYPCLASATSIDFLAADDPMLKAVPPGSRWITVHPHGEGTKGTPVLVQEEKKGVYRVIGGAGGSLNYLKLRGVKSEDEYRAEVAERAKAKREMAREQRKRDKETGMDRVRGEARRRTDEQRIEAEGTFIRTVADAMGWDKSQLDFDTEEHAGLSGKALDAARRKHHSALLGQAREAVDAQRKLLVSSAAARTQANLGEIPLESTDASVLSVEDIAPIPAPSGLGYATNYGQRAAEHGLTESELRAEADEATGADTGQRAQRQANAEAIARELQGIRYPKLDTKSDAPAERAVELLKAQKRLQLIQRAARDARKKIDDAPEPKAYVLTVASDDEVAQKVREDVENDLRTLRTRAFLQEVGKVGGKDYEDSLGRHIGVGAYNSINALALTAGGSALVGRDVVDVLGVAGAAKVLARRLARDLPPDDLADVRRAMTSFHRDHYMRLSEDALKEAGHWLDVAKSGVPDTAWDGESLVRAQEVNAQRRGALEKAKRIIGVSLGEMEANAALVLALESGAPDRVQASLGRVSVADAIRRARAIGLERGDYKVERAGANTLLVVNDAGMERLAQPVSREDIERVHGALDIIEGRRDEDDWLPIGVANRPDLSTHTPEGSVPRIAEPFTPGADLAQSIRDYIGGRTADGDPPAEIMADLLSAHTVQKVPGRESEYFQALDEIAPLRTADGKMIRAETHQPAFEDMADTFVRSRYGDGREPIHRQHFATDQHAVDALHRALAEHPAGVSAFKPIGELTHEDQRALRDIFAQDIARHDPETLAARAELQAHLQDEPEQMVDDMFGRGTNPAWTEWKQRADQMRENLNTKGLDWQKYKRIMGSTEAAYSAVQDVVRSRVTEAFQKTYNRLNPDHALRLGRTVIRGNIHHLDAVDPGARDKRLAEHREMVDRLRERDRGRYAAGSVSEKIAGAREAQEAALQSQMGFFATHEDGAKDKPLAADERWTLGHGAERQIAAMLPIVGQNFKPGRPTRLWNASVTGRFINQQRAIKLLGHNKRLGLAQGVGSGKTFIGLAGFTDLHGKGKVKRGLFLVPSIVQGQFSGEALRYLEPGKYKWAISPGASRAERIASYKDPETHFAVVTHQAFRDDMLALGAEHAGIGQAEMGERLAKMQPDERRDWMRGVMEREGISFDYLNVDEGHNLLNRAGKENSQLANVVDALSDSVPYYVNATADPIKNDPSEAYDLLHKMDRTRYPDRAAFMRRYGVDTIAARAGLRRELARYFYPGRIDPGIQRDRQEITVDLSSTQHARLAEIDRAAARLRLARMRRTVDVGAARELSPSSFEGRPEDQWKDIATRIQGSLGIVKSGAVSRAINEGADNAKISKLVELADERRGQPGVVFAHSRDAVERIERALKDSGHRVVTITGADSPDSKDRKKLAFRPEAGEALADILVCSDAGAVGLNAQRGQWLVQCDTPVTAMTHAQRNGRIDRVGQANNIELMDLVADHPEERRARQRLARKYGLRDVLTSPLEGLDDTGLAGYLNRVRANKAQAELV